MNNKYINKMSKLQKILPILSYIALFIIAIAVGILLKYSFQRENVIIMRNEPFPFRTIREHPTANGVVIFRIDYCKSVDKNGKLRLSFVNNDREVFLPIRNDFTQPGCRIIEYPVVIPSDVEPGQYIVKFVFTYNLNPVKKNITQTFHSSEFLISLEDTKPLP